MPKKISFGQLAEIFNDHATALGSLKDKTARFRATNYVRAAAILQDTPKKQVTTASINATALTPHMKEKALDILHGKPLAKSKPRSRSHSRSKSRSKSTLLKDLTKIMGIGTERAKQLVGLGLTSTTQLKLKKYQAVLPLETKLFLQMNPDQKIPHGYIQKLEPYLTSLASENTKVVLVGSYRRKKPVSSDIDCMIVSDSDSSLDTFLNKLNKTFPNSVYTYSKGPDKISTIINLQHILGTKKPAVYKLDAFRASTADEIPMLLYSTGSKEFNVIMRGVAKRKGYLLNQKGLFKDNVRVTGLDSEKAYFDVLGMQYKTPEER